MELRDQQVRLVHLDKMALQDCKEYLVYVDSLDYLVHLEPREAKGNLVFPV